MSLITVKNVSKTYGNKDEVKVEALKNANFTVEKGEFVCIIGTSGSGKSTLLHLLAGVDGVTEGQIIINNKKITSMNQEQLATFRRDEVGIIYQFFNLVPVLTAKENIELPLMLADKKVDQKYFKQIVEMLKIDNRIGFYPSKLSGGEQQRVAIARALIHKPSIILADEPTGNLNSKLAKEIMEFLVLACKQLNQTIIMITHDLNLAKYADRIIEIQDGRLVSDSKSKIKEVKKTKLREGLNSKTGNFVIDEERFLNAVEILYQLDVKSLKDNNKHAQMTKEMVKYCELFKESTVTLESKGKLLIANSTEQKVKVVIEIKEELYAYINDLEKMTRARKKQILRYLESELQ